MKVSMLFAILMVLILTPFHLLAQNEVERERISLQGLQEFGFTANIEGSRDVADSKDLTPSVIRQQAINKLVDANIRYISDEEVQSSADIPFLYMHINTMQLENGLVPFSIQLRLYQPVTLPLNRDLNTSASTWETGVVGLVSYDRLDMINSAASDLISNFIEDYYKANPNMARLHR
ncbi:MAG: hypothetical protein EA390_01550 [Balneolaceae bacterium]|nr:MAG: hypothetical protein EA390_01550 [Balneolaceae bacterium]